MIFGRMPTAEAEGAILAHSIALPGRNMKKGRVLSAEDVAALLEAGRDHVVAARYEAGDVPEDEAATAVAQAARGAGAKMQAAFTGRCNLYAEAHGIAVIDRARVDALNLLDEAVTIATVPPYAVVEPGQMLATVKIIPFAAPETAVAEAARIAAEGGSLVSVAPLKPHQVGLIMTRLANTKDSVLDKTAKVLSARLDSLGGSRIEREFRTAHDQEEIGVAIREALAGGCDPVLVYGASAITDRRDEIPAGIVQAGGTVEHYGMPVDPGNLLLLGRVGAVPVIGLPGCARSPKVNGFDWVLERLLADLKVTGRDVMRMGAGGLLVEIPTRPQPRAGGDRATEGPTVPRAPRIAAIVLAAGQSRRMGADNKLLAELDGKAMVAQVVDTVLHTEAKPVVVVTGHEAERVKAALGERPVAVVHNPAYGEGLSTSLAAGVKALPRSVDGAIVLLGDMPRVRAEHIEKLIAGFNPVEGRAICVPTYRGKRGNPVLFSTRFFPEMQALAGDTGAKHLLGEHADLVAEVAMADDGIFVDVDTPDALAALKQPAGE